MSGTSPWQRILDARARAGHDRLDAGQTPRTSADETGTAAHEAVAEGGIAQGAVQFARGFGAGAWDGVKGAAEGTASLARGAVRFLVDPSARRQDLDEAGRMAGAAGHAIRHPVETVERAGSAAAGAVRQVQHAYREAVAGGHGAEFIGLAAGETVVAVGVDLLPGGAEAEAAGTVGRIGRTVGAVGDVERSTAAAGRAARTVEHGGVAGATPAAHPWRMVEPGVAGGAAPAAAARGSEVTEADVARFRDRIGVAETKTVAVGRTDVPGLDGQLFEGASPRVRREGGLPSQVQGPIRSPNPNPIATNHAEQDIANQFVAAVERAGLRPSDLNGRTLTMRVDNETGVCDTCRRGLENPATKPGVIKQLSEMYPGLKIHVVVNHPGVELRGPADFTVQAGKLQAARQAVAEAPVMRRVR